MPTGRFHRLPADRQAHILQIAREQFAEQGTETASYNKIISMAGISKASAYQYFDGRADLLTAVLDDVRTRLLDVLGEWQNVATTEQFWRQFEDGGDRLAHHLAGHPDDLALADAALDGADGDYAAGWLATVVDNGLALGVIRGDIERSLLLAVTAAVIRAADRWMVAVLRGRAPEDLLAQVPALLAGLWSGPNSEGEVR